MANRPSEFGRKWNAKVPRGDVRYLVRKYHVGTPITEIEADISARMTAPGYTESIKRQTLEFARLCHDENKALYRRVMTGS